MEVTEKHLHELMVQVRNSSESEENQQKAAYWKWFDNKDWEPAQIRTLPNRHEGGKIPFVVELGLNFWAQILDFNLYDYYHDPLTYAIAQLEMKVFHHKNFADDTFIDKAYRLLIATTLEANLLGVPVVYTKEGHPWLDYNLQPIKTLEDLKEIRLPDFYSSGDMPRLIQFYEKQKDYLDDDFLIKFPDWIMGPFGVAAILRGFDKLLMDMMGEPDFVRELLATIIRSRKVWQKQLDHYLGIPRTKGLLGNDDVNCPTLSPVLYEEFLLPTEIELCEYYGKIFYWHSCGITTPLLSAIRNIPRLDLFHCGPWTSIEKSCEIFGRGDSSVEIVLEPMDKVLFATPEEMKKYLIEAASQIPESTNCYVKVDSLESDGNLEKDLRTIQTWIKTAREVFG